MIYFLPQELTVKGVEAEINKMTSNYQKEIADLKHKHQYELQNVMDEARLNYETKENTIRDSYAKDREGAIERERQALQDRFEKQMKMEQMSFEQQRQRLIGEFTSERDRLYMEMKEKEEIYDNTKENLSKERSEMIEQVKRDYNEKLKIQEIKHQVKSYLYSGSFSFFMILFFCLCYYLFLNFFVLYVTLCDIPYRYVFFFHVTYILMVIVGGLCDMFQFSYSGCFKFET